MKKINLLFLAVLSMVFVSCFGFGEKGNSIIVKNNTNNQITLISFSGEYIRNEPPILLEPHTQTLLISDFRTSGTHIVFSYNERRYKINTGYADDYWRYTIQFLESDTSPFGFECHFIAEGWIFGNDLRNLNVTEISDD